MDIIKKLGGVCVGDEVMFGERYCTVAAVEDNSAMRIEIDESDFTARFDGEKWTVEWKWQNGEPELANGCSEYAIPMDCREEYEDEVSQWIDSGWLVEYNPQVHGRASGILPLMAARQPNKPKKVRPVLDYRELNGFLRSNPGLDVAVCQEKIRKWRKDGSKAAILDLRKAYLQVHMSEKLQRFQRVEYQGKQYVMTRMGFGLCVAPKVMSRIISKVLSMNEAVGKGTDHYIDDIWVNEELVSAQEVKMLLARYGLQSKDPVPLAESRVLGLRVVRESDNCFRWHRDGDIPVLPDAPTKRELFSICGKLTGHYPVAGWLRPACSFLKRQANDVGWDEEIPQRVRTLAGEMLDRISQQDPVTGRWDVRRASDGVVWCDASSLAIGCCLEVDGYIVEDSTWLRKDDGSHINVAELEAIIKGLNMALHWEVTTVKVITDSASVFGWVSSILEDSKRPKVSGLSEMVTKRRLGIIAQLIEEYDMTVKVKLVPSASNKADVLTRVPQKWLQSNCLTMVVEDQQMREKVTAEHQKHHFGVERTLYLVRKILGDVEEAVVRSVVGACEMCRRVDPAPIRWNEGRLSVDEVWKRIAVDVTYVERQPFLTVVDCGPSRYAIWRRLTNEASNNVIKELRQIFRERGIPDEMLSDNGPCFRSREMASFLRGWDVDQVFCCAYRHSGNGIVERNHRTIKRMAARTGGSVIDMVYWYNNSPNHNGVVPVNALHQYEARVPGEVKTVPLDLRNTQSRTYQPGDTVYVKPRLNRCDAVWKKAVVTAIKANNVVEVEGTNRHVADLRPAVAADILITPDEDVRASGVPIEYDIERGGEASSDDNQSDDEHHPSDNGNVRTPRERAQPNRFGNNIYDT
jgi:transposase InsO family protein